MHDVQKALIDKKMSLELKIRQAVTSEIDKEGPDLTYIDIVSVLEYIKLDYYIESKNDSLLDDTSYSVE